MTELESAILFICDKALEYRRDNRRLRRALNLNIRKKKCRR